MDKENANKEKLKTAKNKKAKAGSKNVVLWIALGFGTLLILGVSVILIWFVIRRGTIRDQFNSEIDVLIDEDQDQTRNDQDEDNVSNTQESEDQSSQNKGNGENEQSDADNSYEYLDVSTGMYVYDDEVLTVTMPTNPDQPKDLKIRMDVEEQVTVDFDTSQPYWPKATINGESFTISLVYPYEAFAHELGSQPVLVDSNTQFGDIYRVEESDNFNIYLSDPSLEDGYKVLGTEINSPCGIKLLMDQEDSLITLDFNCESSNVQKCDEMVKSVEVGWEG